MKILSRWTNRVIWKSPCATMRETVVRAVSVEADLSRANLSRAELIGANLSRAELIGADLSGADLRRANLSRANLSRANLSGADLSGADLSRAELIGAELSRAELIGAELSRAELKLIRADFLAEVLTLPNELEFLRDTLIDGKVDGSTYQGECACLAGTMAQAKGIKNYTGANITNGLTFRADANSPREKFFLAIRKGDSPDKNPACKIALEWTNEAIAMRDNIRNTREAAK